VQVCYNLLISGIVSCTKQKNYKGAVILKSEATGDFVNNTEKSLSRNLKVKGILIPIIFAIIVVGLCTFLASDKVAFFPSGNHHDSLTTTAPTQTTEFNENEYAQVIQD
jgi:hypothetical protein